jgi:hypothetical protein
VNVAVEYNIDKCQQRLILEKERQPIIVKGCVVEGGEHLVVARSINLH